MYLLNMASQHIEQAKPVLVVRCSCNAFVALVAVSMPQAVLHCSPLSVKLSSSCIQLLLLSLLLLLQVPLVVLSDHPVTADESITQIQENIGA